MQELSATADELPDKPRRLLVIYNPTAGQRRRRLFEATLAAIRGLGCDVGLRETNGPGHAEKLARDATAGDGDMVVAAGGDGTINEVINGLLSAGARDARMPLAIIPLGTANVLAAEIGLDLDPDQIARTIRHGAVRVISVGQAGTRCFTLMAGVGFDAQVVAEVNTALKRKIGKGAYVWESVRQLWRFAFPEYRLALDGADYRAASAIVANGRYYGGRFVCAPEARLDAPVFQVCLFERPGAWHAARYGLALAAGRVTELPDVRVVPAREVRIDGPPGDPVQGDGDVIGRLPIVIRVLPDALRLAAPPDRQ